MTLKSTYLLQNHILVSTSVIRNVSGDGSSAEPTLRFAVTSPTRVGEEFHVFARLDGKNQRMDFTVAAVGIFVEHAAKDLQAEPPTLGDISSTFAMEALYDWIATAARQATSLYFLPTDIPMQAPEPVLLEASLS